MGRSMRSVGTAALLACVSLASGCATITGSENQVISVETLEAKGGAVAGADCRLSNDSGLWNLKSPGSVSVRRSADDLIVRCELEERPAGTTRAVSRVNAGMFGNVIFGGVVGAVIDHSRGTAYDYPSTLHVVFGTHRVVEDADMPVGAALSPPAASPGAGRPASIDDLGGLLPDNAKQGR